MEMPSSYGCNWQSGVPRGTREINLYTFKHITFDVILMYLIKIYIQIDTSLLTYSARLYNITDNKLLTEK